MSEEPQGDPVPEEVEVPPTDEPLGEGGKKALDAEREARRIAEKHAADLEKKLDDAKKRLTSVKNEGLPEWQQQINDLQERLNGEVKAREEAEKSAQTALLAQLRTDRAAAKGLPAVMAKKLVGLTAEELDAEIDELLPHFGSPGPRPNPQQGNPSQGRGGTLDAGRELFKQNNKT